MQMSTALDPRFTQPRSLGRYASRLTREEERDILVRYRAGETMRSIAASYLVGVGTIHRVLNRVAQRTGK